MSTGNLGKLNGGRVEWTRDREALAMDEIDRLMEKLPPDLQREVREYARCLLERKRHPRRKHLRMKWAGALREFRDQFSSLDLQRKAMEWWGD